MEEEILYYYKVVEQKMQTIGINSAMYFPQFNQIFIPQDLKIDAVLIHEKIHAYFLYNSYGFIIQDFFKILQNLKDHIIDRFENVIDSIVNLDNSIESQILDIDETLSMNDDYVDIFNFYIKMYKKYKILLNNAKVVQEGVACYFSSKANGISNEERYNIEKTISENNFYFTSYQKIVQLAQKWDDLLMDILQSIFMVPYYNYDLVGKRLDEFVEISKFVYNPDQRLEFMLNCSLAEKEQIKEILVNKNLVVHELKQKCGRDNIYHKFPHEMINSAYMLKIHEIMGIEVPNYRRPYENLYIHMDNDELVEYVDVAPDDYRGIEFIMSEHAAMHEQLKDIFRRLRIEKKPIHYDYMPNSSRDYFLFARAKDDKMLIDRILSIRQKTKNREMLTIESANELIDVEIFYLRANAICRRWEKRLMTNTFEIWGDPNTLKHLENKLYLNDFIILQSCSTSDENGYASPELIDAIGKIIVAVGGPAGILYGIAKVIKAYNMNISIDLKNKKIDVTNATFEQVNELFNNIIEKVKEINHEDS